MKQLLRTRHVEDSTIVTVFGAEFQMTELEWRQVEKWIEGRNQEKAMRWWSTSFDIPFMSSVKIINFIQFTF